MVKPDPTNLEILYQDDLEDLVDNLIDQVNESGFKPDFLVGVVRGGAIPAVMMSHKMKIPVLMIHWSSRDNMVGGNESVTFVPEDVNVGKRVLIVEDIVDEGNTIREILEDWQACIRQELCLVNIRVASLVYNTAQELPIKHYAGLEVDRNTDTQWFVLPWER